MSANRFKPSLIHTGIAACALLLAQASARADVSVTLTATATSTQLPDGQSVPMWGLMCGTGAAASSACTTLTGTVQAGTGWQPPLITVPQGQVLNISLINGLSFNGNSIPTSLVIVGQLGGGLGSAPKRMPSPAHGPQGTTWPGTLGGTNAANGDAVFTPPKQIDRVRSFATEVLPGTTPVVLSWSALRPGTYLLESGTEPSIQGPMGLYGVVVVTEPDDASTSAHVAFGTRFDASVPLLLSEIDPVQNREVAQVVQNAGFNETTAWSGLAGACGDVAKPATQHTCYPPAVNYSPLYYLVNGAAFDRSNPTNSSIPVAAAGTQANVLLRFVNAGLRMHVPTLVGGSMTLLAEDGNKVPGNPRIQSEVPLMAGKTYDVAIQPAQTVTGTYDAATYAVFDRALNLSTSGQRDGGMQVLLQVAGGAAVSPAVALNASDKSYYCISGTTLSVTDPSRGLLGGATGANGVVVASNALPAGNSLTVNADGTFTYTPPSAGTCAGSFTYQVNNSATHTATIRQCDSSQSDQGCAVAHAPVVSDITFTSSVASRYVSAPPGVMKGVTSNEGNFDLTAATTAPSGSGIVLNADGSFSATSQGATACAAGLVSQLSLPAGASCRAFPYQVKNAQGTASNTANATVVFLPASNLTVNIKDALTGVAVSDYRWILEEDKTFWIDPKCQVNSTDPNVRPSSCPPLPVESLGYNFHTSNMPVVASGCFGKVSCESGQTVGGTAAVCDVGNGSCRTDASQFTQTTPAAVYLDPNKRYFLSVLPGDSANPVIGGAGGPDANGKPFSIANACGSYSGPTGAWEPGGAAAMCGHEMGGAQIAAGQRTVNIALQELPLPTAKISAFVFEDDYPLNGENDAGGGVDVLAPNEPGLGGFEVTLFDQAGGLGDATGQITYDEFNQPVSNSLAGQIDPITGLDACPITARTDRLIGQIPTCPKYESDGKTESPLQGQVVIANLYPGIYEVSAVPGADREARGEEWLQTNTLDGGKPHEAFIKPDEPGYFQEFGPGGFHVSIGFANPAVINARLKGYCISAANTTPCNNTLTVHVTNTHMSRTPDQRTYSSESYDHYSFTNCYVSVGPADAADFAFQKCQTRTNSDGSTDAFVTFNNMPGGDFKIAVFDQWNDIMLDGLVGTVTIASSSQGATTDKVFPVTQWRTNLYTRTFIDQDQDGVSEDTDPGLALVNTNIHYRDGSVGFYNSTDSNGYATFNEVFPFMNWLVVETTSTRFKPTGVHAIYDAGGPVDGSAQAAALGVDGQSATAAHLANTVARAALPVDLRLPGAKYCTNADCLPGDSGNGASSGTLFPTMPWGVTEGWQGLLGQDSFIEFAMKPFKEAANGRPAENGGIHGMVVYASTRPFDDPSLSLQLQWEPGVPRVQVNLYSKTLDASGNEHLQLVDTTTTASWDDWAQGFRRDANGNLMQSGGGGSSTDAGYISNMNCPGQASDSPFFATLKNSKEWLDAADSSGNKKPLAYQSRFKCYDGWSQLNQIQPAPYDGLYNFPSVVNVDPGTGKSAKTNCSICVTNPDDGTPMLPAGTYVVEVIVPPGYELVKEEDKNILLGDVFVAPVTQQFAGFGNIFIMPDQAAVGTLYNANNPGSLNLTSNLGSETFPRGEGDTGSIEQYWPCVGAERTVPDLNSLFPGAGQAAPFAGATRHLCDRKEVTVRDEAATLAKFYVFSFTHIAGHFAGTITNDFASEFDPFSPQFGEKFAPPNLPVGLRDFNGNEVARVYSDQWGIYNGLYFSTWTVNPPNPTGYAPQMSIACMNDPGPILDPASGQQVTDPQYNSAYSNFCYEQPFMPGFTTYMDTPVIPTQSFADNYNLPDSEYPDGTPAIKSVVNADATLPQGPWVRPGGNGTAATATITFSDVSVGDSVSSVKVGATTLTAGTITCNLQTLCLNLLNQNLRNALMAGLVTASINSRTGTTGYSASTSLGSNVVTITAPAGTAANNTVAVVTQSGITVAGNLTFSGGTAGASAAMNITITALGDKVVQNPNFSGPNATNAPYNLKTITRHYTFGSTAGTVELVGSDNVSHPLQNVVWTDTTITGTVPANLPNCPKQQAGQTAQCGELVITRADNGKRSIDTVTVTVGGSYPWVVAPSGVTAPAGKSVQDYGAMFGRLGPSPIQVALDSASPGDLVIVTPGTYRENLIMWKPVRLQGVGAASVTVNADAHPAGKMDQWRRQVSCAFGLTIEGVPNLNDTKYDPDQTYQCPAAMHQRVDRIPFEAIIGWDSGGNGNLAQVLQEPTLMGAYEGAGITVLGRGVRAPACSNPTYGANCHDFWGQNATGGAGAFTDGSVYLTASSADCAASTTKVDGTDYGTGNYLCNPSAIDGLSVTNSSQGGGGVFIHGWGHNMQLANTRVFGNHGTLAGAVNLGNGETPDSFVNDGVECGAGATSGMVCPPIPVGTVAGAAIPFQFNTHVRIHHNMLYNNASIGDALFSGTPSGAGGITISAGGDNYLIDHNWIAGNLSTGDGGGVQHLGLSFNGTLSHNFVLFNQSTNPTLPTNGGGIVIEGANLDRTLAGNECGSTNDQDCPPGLGEGAGAGTAIDGNLIVGNSAESGSGGGLRLQQINGSDLIAFPNTNNRRAGPAQWYGVSVTNNIIANNVSGWDGAGASLQDALKVSFVNNTIASNDTTATAGVLFKTLGAIDSASNPPGCVPQTDPSLPQSPSCTNPNAPHSPEPAGLVVQGHTQNLLAAIGGVTLSCPSGYGYSGTNNGDCRVVSKPAMANDLFWQNRAFSVEIVDAQGNIVSDSNTNPTGAGLQSQQNLVALFPGLKQTSTGECVSGADYWDLGIRTDDIQDHAIPATTKLTLTNSILTGLTGGDHLSGDVQNVVASMATDSAPNASPLIAPYCNGARVPPENGGTGYNSPPGASETTGVTSVFVFKGIQPTATVDEGHNWLNLSYGPLTLGKPNATTATAGELLVASASVATPAAAYSVPASSPAVGSGTSTGAPSSDFFGVSRVGHAITIGAVQVDPPTPTLASVSPNSGPRASTVPVTLTGNYLASATAVNVSGGGVTCTITGSPTATTVNANCNISGGAATTPRTMTVTTGGGTSNGVTFTVTVPLPPALTSIAPTSGVRGNAVAVTLTGSNLAGASAVTASGTGVNCTITSPSTATTVNASCAIASGAAATGRQVTVTTGGGTSNGVTFTVTSPPAPTLTAISPTSGSRNSTVTMTLSGTNLSYSPSIVVTGNGVSCNLTSTSDSTLMARCTISRFAATGSHLVSVNTTGGTTATRTFTVN